MAPPHETPNVDWDRSLIEHATGVEPASTERGDGEDEQIDTDSDDPTRERIVPRARCRECSEQPAVRGLCIECFLK